MIASPKAKTFLTRLVILGLFVLAVWGVQVVNWVTGYGLNRAFGLIPRHLAGLDGIVGMPFLHGSFAHLTSNTPPMPSLGAPSTCCVPAA